MFNVPKVYEYTLIDLMSFLKMCWFIYMASKLSTLGRLFCKQNADDCQNTIYAPQMLLAQCAFETIRGFNLIVSLKHYVQHH